MAQSRLRLLELKYLGLAQELEAVSSWRERRSVAQALHNDICIRAVVLRKKRRGQFYRQLLLKIATVVEAAIEDWETDEDAKAVAECLLVFLGKLSTRSSHRLLARFLRESNNHEVRGLVLTSMAFEKIPVFKVRLVLPYLKSEYLYTEVLSALYALQLRRFSPDLQELVLRAIAPYAHHPYPLIPGYVGHALSSVNEPEIMLTRMIKNEDCPEREALVSFLDYIQTNDEIWHMLEEYKTWYL